MDFRRKVSLNEGKIFSSHCFCRKMCCQKFENRLTNKKNCAKYFDKDFSTVKSMEGYQCDVTIFPENYESQNI